MAFRKDKAMTVFKRIGFVLVCCINGGCAGAQAEPGMPAEDMRAVLSSRFGARSSTQSACRRIPSDHTC